MDNQIQQELWTLFKSLGTEALAMNHYDLADATQTYNPEIWKEFLISQEVSDWIKSELAVIQNSELNKLINGISKSHSVGQAQIMNTLAKLTEQRTVREGPVFIYTYIPLSPEQRQAENVVMLTSDPFID